MQTDLHLISDAPERARATAHEALGWLQEHQASPGPVQYVVSYVHLSEMNRDLSLALEDRLKAQAKLPDQAWRDLFDQFIVANSAALPSGMSEAIKTLLEAAAQHMSQAGRDAQDFDSEVTEAVSGLSSGESLTSEGLLHLGQRLLSVSAKARDRARVMERKMQESLDETAKLRAELDAQRRAALHDGLTGLLNRRGMEARFTALLQAGQSSALAVLMLDIDHFKAFNDKFGHAVGDAVIRNVAQVIRASIRAKDDAIRYGGEEFLVILPEAAAEDAQRLAEMIRGKIAALRLRRRSDDMTLPPLTVSIGVATLGPGDDAESLIQRADDALYVSKNGGRNRVSVALREEDAV